MSIYDPYGDDYGPDTPDLDEINPSRPSLLPVDDCACPACEELANAGHQGAPSPSGLCYACDTYGCTPTQGRCRGGEEITEDVPFDVMDSIAADFGIDLPARRAAAIERQKAGHGPWGD